MIASEAPLERVQYIDVMEYFYCIVLLTRSLVQMPGIAFLAIPCEVTAHDQDPIPTPVRPARFGIHNSEESGAHGLDAHRA